MRSSVERVDETTVELTVEVEPERVTAAIDAAARDLSHQVSVPGFRPGRVPRKVLEGRLGAGAIEDEAARRVVPELYREAVEHEELAAVGRPEVEVERFSAEEGGRFRAKVEVVPEVDPPDPSGLRVPHPDWEVADDEIDEQLDGLRRRVAELETVERPARPGDRVVVAITGLRDGERVEEASGEDLLYEVGDPEATDREMDRHVVGAAAGDEVAFADVLAEDFGELAGQRLDFRVEVREVKELRLPEVDDDFAEQVAGLDSAEELRGEIVRQMRRQRLAQARQELRGTVVDRLAEQVEMTPPVGMVREELDMRLRQISRQAEQEGMEVDQLLQAATGKSPEEAMADLEAEAERTVRAQLVVDAVGRRLGVELSEDDLVGELGQQAGRLGMSPQELAGQLDAHDQIGALATDAFRRKVVDHLLEQVEVLGGPTPEETAELLGPDEGADDGGEPGEADDAGAPGGDADDDGEDAEDDAGGERAEPDDGGDGRAGDAGDREG